MTRIYFVDGLLAFEGQTLATLLQFMSADRCVGSVFEALSPGEAVELQDGTYVLDGDLDPQ